MLLGTWEVFQNLDKMNNRLNKARYLSSNMCLYQGTIAEHVSASKQAKIM